MSKYPTLFIGLSLIAAFMACGPDGPSVSEVSQMEPEPTDLEEAVQVVPEAAFVLVLQADSYGTFLPINNQFRSSTPPAVTPFYSGFFVQLSDFAGALHSYDDVLLTFEDGSKEKLLRADFRWIDVVCSANFPQVLTPSQAGELLPQAAEDGRLLHVDMDWERTSLLTLWKSENGVSVKVASKEYPGAPEFAHVHDRFTFESPDACAVRVWKDLSTEAGLAAEYLPSDPATHVTRIQVREPSLPTPHGGVHHPPWG